MAHFFLKLIPPRASFPFDITDEERAIMADHAVYLKEIFVAGKLLSYGPVFDTAGAYGMGIFETADQAEAEAIMAQDPSITSGLNTFALFPMRVTGAQASRAARDS
jgi:uncharacterized protein YciI